MTSPTMTSTGDRAGFTLVELILVVVILATIASIAVPRYAGSLDYMRLRSAALDVAATAEHAQHTAIIEGRRLRLRVAEDGGSCVVESYGDDAHEETFRSLVYTLPDRVTLHSPEFDDSLLAHRKYVAFHPDGHVDRSFIALSNAAGDAFRVHLASGVGAIRLERTDGRP